MKKGKRGKKNMFCRIKKHGSSDWGKLLNLNQVNKEDYIVRYKTSWWNYRTLNRTSISKATWMKGRFFSKGQ